MSKKEEAVIPFEEEAIDQWRRLQEPPATLQESLDMYELYLNGYTVEDIYKAKNGTMELGKIADAKIRYNWDKQKKTQMTNLFKKVEERVVKTKADAVFFLTDALAVAHKSMGDKFKKFIETGDPEVLGAFDPTNMRNYETFFKLFQTLTSPQTGPGRPSKQEVNVSGTVSHDHILEVKPSDTKSAAKLLEMLDGQILDKKEDE